LVNATSESKLAVCLCPPSNAMTTPILHLLIVFM
jgi:hypothetical protein